MDDKEPSCPPRIRAIRCIRPFSTRSNSHTAWPRCGRVSLNPARASVWGQMRRRDFITLVGGVAIARPLAARAQQPALPVIGFLNGGARDGSARYLTAFHTGLGETGYVEAHNVLIEYCWLEGQYDRLPALMGEFVRRRVAVIAAPGSTTIALGAKAATATIPIVFGVAEHPVRLGLVASLARPGGNATGVNFFVNEVGPKRLGPRHWIVDRRPQGQHQPRDRNGLRGHGARAGRGSLRRPGRVFQRPARPICRARGAPPNSCGLFQPRLR